MADNIFLSAWKGQLDNQGWPLVSFIGPSRVSHAAHTTPGGQEQQRYLVSQPLADKSVLQARVLQ